MFARFAILVVACLGLVACNDDGRALAPAPTVPVSPATLAPSTSTSTSTPFSVSSPAVGLDGRIDASFTCDGIDVHPAIDLTAVPMGTVELALSVVDLDDGDVRWVVSGLAGTTTAVEAGVLPPTAVTATAADGTPGWDGPCPAQDRDGPARYLLTAYATAEPIGMAPDLDGATALRIVQDAAVGTASTIFSYERAAPS